MRAPTYRGPGWHSSAPGVWRLLSATGERLGPACVRVAWATWIYTCDGRTWLGEGESIPLDLAMQAAQGEPIVRRPQERRG